MNRLIALLLLFVCHCSIAQQLNGYAAISAVSGAVLTVSSSNTSAHAFLVGENVIVMQMQDNVLGNTTQSSSFGSLSGTGLNAGNYEIATISAIGGTGATPTSFTLTAALTNSYSTGANASLQVISFQNIGTPNYATTANITPVAWNGSLGGVVAIQVTGILTLNHNITANGVGFVGGSRSVDYYSGGTTCDTVAATWFSGSSNRGEKGEGIYKRTSAAYRYGKAKIVNGGGGGVNINVGGGGGGNYTAGGTSGPGWNSGSGCAAGAESLGGITLSSIISGNRVFMGGGGGGGQQNNSASTNGGNGGGIILIKATQIVTTGSCGGRIISANGVTPSGTTGNDGAGGGGAGGSIVLTVPTFSIVAGCNLAITANGGNGSSVTDPGVHSGGGGGGQGAVIFSGVQPTTNVTTTTNNGTGGLNSAGGSNAPSGAGTNNSGIIVGAPSPLPIELITFRGIVQSKSNKLFWSTASELNNNYFTLEKSSDAISFKPFAIISGAGNSTILNNYSYFDLAPFNGITYYRLKQTDFDGTSKYANIISLDNKYDQINVSNVYPNPANQLVNFDFYSPIEGKLSVSVYAYNGQLISQESFSIQEGNNNLKKAINDYSKGIYLIHFYFDQTAYTHATILEKE